jgi:four helix bundle protein
MYSSLPQGQMAQVLGKQALRSGTSIGAHYREANRARSDAEFLSKVRLALQELDETAYWLELLIEAEIVPVEKLADLLHETDELLAIFVTIAKKVEEKGKRKK